MPTKPPDQASFRRRIPAYSRSMPTPARFAGALVLALLSVLPAACSAPSFGAPVAQEVETAPSQGFAVGMRRMAWQRNPARPLPTIVWYPAAGPIGADPIADAPPAGGRYPVVLLSHGLGGQPEGFVDVAKTLAAAGFVVAAPAYPYTKKHSPHFDRNDVRNQPADAEYVLGEVIKMEFASARRCAAGFSAGGFTTSGLFTSERNPQLRCGIVISAGAIEGGFTGAPAPILFVHGDADRTVPYSRGRSAYADLAWPKAFLTMHGQGHGEFLDAKRPGFPAAMATMLDFLRWNLYGDTAARDRLAADGSSPGLASLELSLAS
jgi:predicted dienelactone hydrolase